MENVVSQERWSLKRGGLSIEKFLKKGTTVVGDVMYYL